MLLIYEIIENLDCQGCQIRQPPTKNIDRERYFIMCFEVFFKSQMRHVCYQIFPKLVCSMVKFSMPAILDRILHSLQVKLCILGSHIF